MKQESTFLRLLERKWFRYCYYGSAIIAALVVIFLCEFSDYRKYQRTKAAATLHTPEQP